MSRLAWFFMIGFRDYRRQHVKKGERLPSPIRRRGPKPGSSREQTRELQPSKPLNLRLLTRYIPLSVRKLVIGAEMSRLTFLIRAAAVAAVTTSLALVGATGGVSQATTAPSFTVKVLSPFGPNAGDDYPTGLNNAGQIVGYVQSSSAIRGFFYEPGTGGSGRSYAVPVPKGDHAAAFNAVDNGSLAAGFVCVDEACKHYLPYAGRIAGSTAALFALRPPSTQTLALGSAYAIDAAGDVTGFVRLASGQSFGVEWRNRGSLSK